jgi:cell wall-associated NlpC family hydrolase
MMSVDEFSIAMDHLRRSGVRYVAGSHDVSNGLYCWSFYRYAYKICGLGELPMDIYDARKYFVPRTNGAPRFMDIVVFRPHHFLGERHVGVMIDNEWMYHCSMMCSGIGRASIYRVPYSITKRSFGRPLAVDV